MRPPPVAVVIEDQAELSQVLKDVLGGEGFEVVTVRSTVEAQAVLRERAVTLVVSDLPSIGTSNDDPLGPVLRDFPDVEIVVVRDPEDEAIPFFGPWRRDGAKLILRRPFRLDDLLHAVREIHPA
jgi:DNA-binding NtrC family response regulator